jgi:hypothetical protein
MLLLLASPFYTAGFGASVPGRMRRDRREASVFSQAGEDEGLRKLEQKIASLTTADVEGLARALGVQLMAQDDRSDFSESLIPQGSQLRPLGGFKNRRNPECVLFLSGQGAAEGGESAAQSLPHGEAGWTLALLAWDGARWRLSPLDEPRPGQGGPEIMRPEMVPLGARIISASRSDQMMALLLYAPPARALYPMVYQVKDHQASLVWDSLSDDSRYQALSGGRIEFDKMERGGIPAMVTSGKADPGLLVFARDGARGFQARTTYQWKGNEYVPIVTEYEANEDLRLYEFISALHLHNYKAAYALIDPAKFLRSDKPSLDAFRDTLQKSWSEFLDDNIFTASTAAAAEGNAHAFELEEAGKKMKYLPEFSPGPKYLLTGLARQEE